MARSFVITPEELSRQGAACFGGKEANVMLCNSDPIGDATVVEWQTLEIASAGYARHTQQLQPGAIDGVTGRLRLPDIVASFTSSGQTGFSFSRVVVYFTGETHPYCVISESPAVPVAPGQVQAYRIAIELGQ